MKEIQPPNGYPVSFNIDIRHKHQAHDGIVYIGEYISNASPFYYAGQYNQQPMYIGKNNVRFWADSNWVYQIGTGFAPGTIEKYDDMTTKSLYSTYKCKYCEIWFNANN